MAPHLTKRQSSLNSHHSNQVEEEDLDEHAALLNLPQLLWGGKSVRKYREEVLVDGCGLGETNN